MKNKFQRLNKVERKEAIKEFKNANKKNATIYNNLFKTKILMWIGIIYSVFFISYSLITKTGKWWEYVTYCFVLILAIIFLFKATDMLSSSINKYLINKKNGQK